MPYSKTQSTLPPHQRVRLVADYTPGPRSGPTNLHDAWGPYYEAWIQGGDIWIARSDHATPPFAFEAQVTTGGADSHPSLRLDPDKRLWCVFQRSGSAYGTYSDDDGLTWGTPAVVIASGTKPRMATAPDGTQVIFARVGTALRGIRPTDETPAEFAITRWNGATLVALTTEDEVFDVSFGWAPDAPLMLVCKLTGSPDINHLVSYDFGESFLEI